MANFLLISCRCIIVLFCYFLSLSQSSHGQTLSLLWPSSCRRRRLLKQRFQFDRDLLVVYDPQEKTFWDPHLFILFSSTVTSTDESKEVTSSTERISFSREGLHVNFQGAAVGLEHECVKCTSQTIQRVSLACISWQVLGDDTRAELEERQAKPFCFLLHPQYGMNSFEWPSGAHGTEVACERCERLNSFETPLAWQAIQINKQY